VGSFRVETHIAAPAVACFELSLSVDAHVASMSASGERAVAGVTTGVMRLGDTVTWRATHFGIPFRMTSAITEFDRPSWFVDEQVAGPFARWRHEHSFAATTAGTLMTDVVDFAAPLGPLGRLVERAVLDRYLRGLILERNRHLKGALETAEGPDQATEPPGAPSPE
jgi:ligand-binding SRPBCC domain-containing protein